MHKFFIWLKVCCIPPNVGGSEKSRLWLGISGSEKNRGDFAVFRPQGRHDALIVAKLSTSEETKNPLRRAKFQVGRSIYGISDPKNFKNPRFCKLIPSLGANPSIDIYEIYKFYAPMGS